MALTTSYTEAFLVTPAVAGKPGQVDTTPINQIGTEARDQFGNEYVYLYGATSVAEGSAVTFDEAGAVTLLAANAKGPVAWATAAIDATTKAGWFARKGMKLLCVMAASSADNALLGRETTDGSIGDGRAAGDEIYGVISRGATPTSGLGAIQVMSYPFVDDANGS